MNLNSVVKLAALRDLVDAKSIRGATRVGEKGGWVVAVRYGQAERILAGRNGQPRLFAKLDTAAKQLLDLGLVSFEVHGSGYEDTPTRSARPDRSVAMKAANDYVRWLKAEVDHTSDRVARGEAELFTLEQAKTRGDTKRAEVLKRQKADG